MTPAATAAQDVVGSQVCELRIITTDNLNIADSTDFKDGGLVGGLLSGLYKKQDPLLAHDIAHEEVGEAGQKRLFAARLADIPTRFSGYAISFEAGGQRPLAAYHAAKRSGRLSSSTAPCLAEFAVIGASYIRTSLSRTFAVALMYRQFGAGTKPDMVVLFGKSQKVNAFPPTTSENATLAREELRLIFDNSISGFFAKISKEVRK